MNIKCLLYYETVFFYRGDRRSENLRVHTLMQDLLNCNHGRESKSMNSEFLYFYPHEGSHEGLNSTMLSWI